MIVGKLNTVNIPDMAVVTFGHRVPDRDSYTPIVNKVDHLIEIPRAIGTHAYGLSPVTAKWLVDDAINDGVKMEVDRYLMMDCKSGLPPYTWQNHHRQCVGLENLLLGGALNETLLIFQRPYLLLGIRG